MSDRPIPRENLNSLGEQFIWGLRTYVKAGIDDMKGDGWDADRDTLHEMGLNILHETHVFPESTDQTITIPGHVNPNVYSGWAEIVDAPGGTTFSSVISDESHITAINIEDTSVSGKIWMLEIAYGDAKTRIAIIRFISSSTGNLPAITGVRIRATHIPNGELVYARLMCSSGGEDCMIHIRYYVHVHV